MSKDLLLYGLILFDLLIIILLVLFYLKIQRFLKLPWEEIEESILKAQELVKNLKELQRQTDKTPQRSSTEEKILELYREGVNIKEIAKRLQLSVGEVELFLKKKGLLK